MGAPLWLTHSICLPVFLLSRGPRPNNFQWFIWSILPLHFFPFFWEEWRRMSGGKRLERIRLPASSALWSQCRSALIPAWNLSHHLPSCLRLPDPSNTKTCTQVRQINGFNLTIPAYPFVGCVDAPWASPPQESSGGQNALVLSLQAHTSHIWPRVSAQLLYFCSCFIVSFPCDTWIHNAQFFAFVLAECRG